MENEFKPYASFNPSGFSGRATQLNEFISRRHHTHLDAGDAQRNQLDTVEKVEAHAKKMRETFIEKIGGIPERDCPLDAQITGVRDNGTYMVESIVFRARKGAYVTASMYIPKGLTGPQAAVLFLSGHTVEARMSDPYQRISQTLAEAGLVVFAVDPVGQGERHSFYKRETGEFITRDAVGDHDLCGIPSLATGRFLESYFMNDQFAAVDYMLTRPEIIDPARIGVTGCSGGGLQSLSIMTCDDRIAAAAPACFTTTRREILYTNQSQDSEQIWPGCAVYGFDHFEPYIIFAPKPALILTASSDFFPIEGAYEVYDKMKEIYALYGKEENIEIFEVNTCHGYPQEQGEEAADFFCRVFGVERKHPTNYKPIPVKEMQATACGNVLGAFEDAIAITDETRARAAELRKNRKSAEAEAWLTEKVNYARIPSKPWVRISDQFNDCHINGYTGKAIMWWVQKQLCAFGAIIANGDNPHPIQAETIIALWDNGSRAICEHEEWIKEQCDAGKQVLVVDLPGVGALEQAKLWGWSGYHGRYGTMYKMCCDLMYMDDSMAAMQTYHVLRTIDMVRDVLHIDDITLYCDEQEGVYGIMAGYLTGVKRVYGEKLLTSIEKQIISQYPLSYDNTLSYIIPGMLEYFDYDELMR
ncbi:MAG: prolyl oligopeptidase family serine peptidase [Clostridia bacterium]|nr:prolyl oligopeptidase family serine peptidase [Clostridia bacterium]